MRFLYGYIDGYIGRLDRHIAAMSMVTLKQ